MSYNFKEPTNIAAVFCVLIMFTKNHVSYNSQNNSHQFAVFVVFLHFLGQNRKFVSILPAVWDFFSQCSQAFVTYSVYLHYSSDTDNILLGFPLLRWGYPSYSFGFISILLYTSVYYIKEWFDYSLAKDF